MKISNAESSHIPSILEIWKQMMDSHIQFDPIFTRSDAGEEKFTAYLEKIINSEDSILLVATENNETRGYTIAKIETYPPVLKERTYGDISDLAVLQGHRRKGIGKKLLEETLIWFESQGVNRVELRVASQNPIANSFWKKHGFKDYMHILYKNMQK